MDSTDVKITYGLAHDDFKTGFAEGYSQAWIDCWEYMREKILEDNKKPEPAHAESSDSEGKEKVMTKAAEWAAAVEQR